MKARICVIGNGAFANKVHLPALASFNDVEIVGLLAFSKERLQQTAATYGLKAEQVIGLSSPTEYQQHILRLQPHGVYAIGQPDQMFNIWLWCLQNKFNLYIEKPMGLNWHQANILAQLAKKNGCITQVSLQRRSSPLLNLALEKCSERGAITHAIVSFSKNDRVPMLGPRDRMLDDFIHCIDTARWIGNSEVIKIESKCRRLGTPDINWINATLYFENGTVCYTVGNWTSGRRIFKAEIHAPGICAEVEPEKEARIFADGNYEGELLDSKLVAGSDDLIVYGGFLKKHREFIDSVISGIEQTSSPFSDTLKTMKVCESILAQSLLNP